MARVCTILIASLVFISSAQAMTRVALVIGNSVYENSGTLNNPRNDAADVAAVLKKLDFDVTELHDLKIRGFDRALDEFGRKAEGADIALFFYAGHGLTIDKRGFLVPVDFAAESTSTAFRELVAIEAVISRIEHSAKASVIIFDACRDSPMAERLRRMSIAQNRALPPRGLPSIPTSVLGSNPLVVFATVPGEVAEDGVGQRNSPFASALLKHIGTPGLEIQSVLTRVTGEVLQATGGRQQPERVSRLQTELIFLSASRQPEIQTPMPLSPPKADRLAVSNDASGSIRQDKQTPAPLSPPKSDKLAILNDVITFPNEVGQFWVQIAVRNDQDAAMEAFASLQQKYAAALGKHPVSVRKVYLGEKGVWFRLLVGPATSQSAADQLCEQLKTAGIKGCFTRKE